MVIKLTLVNFIKAITAKLNELYPDRVVHIGEIPREADGNFYIRLVDSSQQKHLDRRRKRVLQFEVLYYCKERDTVKFLEWAEAMYENFERLTVAAGSGGSGESRSIALKNQKAYENRNTMMYQFMFDAEFHFVLEAEEIPLMEELIHDERMKE